MYVYNLNTIKQKKEKKVMKNLETVARVHTHTHTQGDLIKRTNKADNVSLYINVYKTDRLLI